MASTDSSQMNFNPSWMQSPSKGERPNGFALPAEGDHSHEVMDPVFANHRYGREDILALMSKDIKPPDGLKDCPFFVENAQTPMILMPLNEIELRLQQNINSSKALSVLNRQDRNTFLNGNDSPTSNPSANPNKWTVAGANRGINTANKPLSNRWSTVAAGNNSSTNDGGASFRGGRVGPPHFGRGGTGARPGELPQSSPPKTFNPRFRQSCNYNDAFAGADHNTNTSAADGPTTPSTYKHNPWTRVNKPTAPTSVAAVVNNAADTAPSRPASKSGDQVFLEDLRRPAPVVRQDTKKTISSNYQQQPIQQPSETIDRMRPTHLSSNQPRLVGEKHSGSPKLDNKWNYVDPGGVERGPFESRQMQSWFENGFFDGTLLIAKAGTKNYIKLADLFIINGALTPFIVKSTSPTPPTGSDASKVFDTVNRTSSKPTPNTVIGTHAATSIWGDVTPVGGVTAPISRVLSPFLVGGGGSGENSMFKPQQEPSIDKILQEKQLALAEEQRKLREKEELLLREERERAEKELEIRQRELELQRKQAELERIAREKEQELENKRLQMAEFERQRREALEQIEEKLRSEQLQKIRQMEEERLRLEAEAVERRKAEEECRLREQEEAKIRAAYEEARLLKEMAQRAEEEQRKALIAEQEARKRKEREEKKQAAELEAKQKREREERALAEKRQREEEREEEERVRRRKMEEELSRAAIQEILNAEQGPLMPKVTPWVTVGGAKTGGGIAKKDKSAKAEEARGKSLLEIQREEEIALRESLERRQEEQRRHTQAVPQQQHPSGAWASVERNHGWGASPVVSSKQGSSHVVWGNVPVPVPVEIPKAANAQSKKTGATQKKQQSQQQAKKTEAVFDKPKPDAFITWIMRRVRELNSSVDAEVFAAFIEGVESPDEAEDYIIGYLGESKASKEFHREFLAKRIELRPRTLRMVKDDLSCPAAASKDVLGGATSSNVSGGSSSPKDGNNGKNALSKKKKGKAHKIDPTVLGFRAAGDPNRFNAGEIDTAIPTPANRRR